MPRQTSRLFELLELLQGRTIVTGREICDRLGVDPRTARRYVAALQELGVPIDGQRGVGGGYRVRPGYRLPPLMLDNDEAFAVSLGLLAARRLPLAGEEAAVDRALAKVHRVLPDELRRRLEGLDSTIAFAPGRGEGAPIGSEQALVLADAIRRRRRVRARYVSHGGERSSRLLSPWGLVVYSTRWYLAAFDHDRAAERIFRADRCSDLEIVDGAYEPAPADFDAVAEVSASFARIPRDWRVDLTLDLPLETATARLPLSLAELSPVPGGTRLQTHVDSLDRLAAIVAGLDCDFTIAEPAELRDRLRALAERLERRVGA